MIEVNPTEETKTLGCAECERSFSLTLDPDFAPLGRERVEEAGYVKAEVKFCPFCGEEALAPE